MSVDSDHSTDYVAFELALTADRDHFFRRTCPSCGLDFKTAIDEADLSTLLAPQVQQIGKEMGAFPSNDVEDHQKTIDMLSCPYCGNTEREDRMLSEDIERYIVRVLFRQVVLPTINAVFSNLATGDGQIRSQGPVRIETEYHRSLLPPRPIHGPDPPDMFILDMLCCGKRLKTVGGALPTGRCPYCCSKVTVR